MTRYKFSSYQHGWELKLTDFQRYGAGIVTIPMRVDNLIVR